MKSTHLLVFALAPMIMSGCAGTLNTAGSHDFACPGMPEGAICQSPKQVYEQTNHQDHVTSGPGDVANQDTERHVQSVSTPASPMLVSIQAQPNLPQPVLEPAKVLRIWIAPWEDSKKDLHWPSYVFTEIQPRKWSFGNPEFAGTQPIVPHLMLGNSVSANPPPTSSSPSASGKQPSTRARGSTEQQAVAEIPTVAMPQPSDAMLGMK